MHIYILPFRAKHRVYKMSGSTSDRLHELMLLSFEVFQVTLYESGSQEIHENILFYNGFLNAMAMKSIQT